MSKELRMLVVRNGKECTLKLSGLSPAEMKAARQALGTEAWQARARARLELADRGLYRVQRRGGVVDLPMAELTAEERADQAEFFRTNGALMHALADEAGGQR